MQTPSAQELTPRSSVFVSRVVRPTIPVSPGRFLVEGGVRRRCHSAKWHDPFGRVAVHHKSFILSVLRHFSGATLPNCHFANGPRLRSGLPHGARMVAQPQERLLPKGTAVAPQTRGSHSPDGTGNGPAPHSNIASTDGKLYSDQIEGHARNGRVTPDSRMRRFIPPPNAVIQTVRWRGAHGKQSRRGGQAMLPRITINDMRSRVIGNPDHTC
jgi:hypothetical protein